jgi:hypothetical protein
MVVRKKWRMRKEKEVQEDKDKDKDTNKELHAITNAISSRQRNSRITDRLKHNAAFSTKDNCVTELLPNHKTIM